MDREQDFDLPLTDEQLRQYQEELEEANWKINNKYNRKQTRDFYMGQLVAYNNVVNLIRSHPDAGKPDFVDNVCNMLLADSAMILKEKPLIHLLGGSPPPNLIG